MQKIRRFSDFGIGSSLDYFIENLSMLVMSGMNIVESLAVLEGDIKNKKMKQIIGQIKTQVMEGVSLSKAIENVGIFADYTVSLVKIGEESGKLSDNLKVISEQQEKDRNFKSKIRSAITYPIFVLVLTMVIGISIAWFILPKLAKVFDSLHADLPVSTKILIQIGAFFGKYGLVAIPSFFIIMGLIIYVLFFMKKTKIIGQRMFMFIPAIRRIAQETEVARFGYLFGTLLDAGIPIDHALQSIASSSSISIYKKYYTQLLEQVRSGESFKKSFTKFSTTQKLLPTPVQQLIISGENSGGLPKVLIKIGQNYEQKLDNTTKNLATILEPLLLVIVWLGVVAVAMSVILPIYNLIGNFNTN
ncbi:type II secretion system F family protein [Candidatus Berkelbacteria bacterium]|nr:type II secretion system F family protein [Candidatus Berkelbacteria bacterium]